MPLTLEEQLGAVEAMTQFARLSALDGVWTDYLERASQPIPQEDIYVLGTLTDAMTQLLKEGHDRARYLRTVMARHTEELEEAYAQIIDSDWLGELDRYRLDETIQRRGGLLSFCSSGLDGVFSEASVEAEKLRAKMDTIRGGEFAPGDLSAKFMCNLAGGLVCSALFAPPPMNLVGLTMALALVVGVEVRGEEC